MSLLRLLLVLVSSLSLISIPISAQQASTATPAPVLLQQSLTAQLGNTQVSDAILIGAARRIVGSSDESGTATLKVLSSGVARVDLVLPSGTRSEVRTFASGTPAGSWSGPDGIAHAIANHNLINDWGWFPAFTVANAATTALTLVGIESRNGESVLHLTSSQQFVEKSVKVATLMQHLSQIDIFLDATTLLPSSIVYSAHPDDNALRDIPVELRFSDYRTVNGAQIPFHIQKFLNNSLLLDLQFQSVALNTGLTSSQIGGAL